MIVVGVGGTDSFAEAEEFAATYGGPSHLLWSESLTAWRHYRAGNPALVLLDATGNTELERMTGGFDESRIVAALG